MPEKPITVHVWKEWNLVAFPWSVNARSPDGWLPHDDIFATREAALAYARSLKERLGAVEIRED